MESSLQVYEPLILPSDRSRLLNGLNAVELTKGSLKRNHNKLSSLLIIAHTNETRWVEFLSKTTQTLLKLTLMA